MEEPEKLNLLTTLIPFVILVFIITIGVVLMNQQFRKNLYKQLLEKESLKIRHQEKLLETAVNVQEDERKRIARDLHDELGAALSIGRMQLVQLERSQTRDQEKITSIRELIENTLASTRRISHELAPLNLENLGLEKVLKSLVSKLKESSDLNGIVTIPVFPQKLPWLLELGLYRIYSELINNTIKYANASELEITIVKESNELICHYKDNGKGVEDDQTSAGLGFSSIESRVDMLKGSWEYGNQEKTGFFANFRFTLENDKTTN